MDRFLEPTYLETDFQTSKERLQELMENSDTFKDYNYEGSNITMLIELISFLNDNSTYFMNKLIKNIYPESAEVYETIHSVASIRGYRPKGWIAPQLNLTVNVLVDNEVDHLPSAGEQLLIPAWFSIDTGEESENGEPIWYITTDDYTIDIPEDLEYGEYSFTIPMKQGKPETLSFTGDDIVDNKIIMPFFNFDYDTTPFDTNPSIWLYVNGEPWSRVEEFRQSYLNSENDVYILEYDKYQRYNIVFSPSHIVPKEGDQISVFINKTLGPDGDVYAKYIKDFDMVRELPVLDDNKIITVEKRFINNVTRDMTIGEDYIQIWNNDSSFNSAKPESINQIRLNSRGMMYGQFRNINNRDYVDHLREHPDVVVGNAWGEADIDPQNTEEYNKVYISVVPYEFQDGTIESETLTWEREGLSLSQQITKPIQYNESFKSSVFKHLESRKGLCVYETAIIPDLVYFAFDIGISTKRSYNFVNVREDLKRKLQFYFKGINRSFNEIIDFKKMQNFLLDVSVRDELNKRFDQVKGIESIVFRDILTYTPSLETPEMIYNPNTDLNFPMFTEESFEMDFDNVLRPIKLGLNQFPVLAVDNCVFIHEK